jgi:hypothetical protein
MSDASCIKEYCIMTSQLTSRIPWRRIAIVAILALVAAGG